MSEYINGLEVAPVVVVKEQHNYSTNEQIVGTWIDGKPLYEKTIVIPEFVFSGITAVEHGIANVRFGWVVEAILLRNTKEPTTGGTPDDVSKNVINEYVYSFKDTSDAMRGVVWGMNDTYIKYRFSGTGISSGYYDCYVTVQYTKTTDVTEVNI